MSNDINRILYISNSAENVVQFRQLIRSLNVEGEITFNIQTLDSLDNIEIALTDHSCDLVLLEDSPQLPSLPEVNNLIGMRTIPVIVLVDDELFLTKRSTMMDEGAVDVGLLSQGESLFKQVTRAIFEVKTQRGYKDTLEKNAKLTELIVQSTEESRNLIAYFGKDDGLYLHANDAYLAHFGLQNLQALTATTVLDYFLSDSIAEFKKMMKIVGRTGKEQKGQLQVINPFDQKVTEEQVTLKSSLYEDIPCIEIIIGHEAEEVVVVRGVDDNKTLSKEVEFYNRLNFINGLTNFIGSSSWLVSLVLGNYFGFRKKHGINTLENYFFELSQHLETQIDNLHYVRYSDESIVLLLTNSDMAKVDRLGAAITSSADSFIYTVGEELIQANFSFYYTNLGDSQEALFESLNRLDKVSGLVDSRVVYSAENEEEALQKTADLEKQSATDGIDEEYMPLYDSMENDKIKQVYVPVVDFSMKGKEIYMASFTLFDENDAPIVWNKSFTYTATNSLMKRLDLYMIKSAAEILTTKGNANHVLIIPISQYFLENYPELIEEIKTKYHSVFSQQQIIIGFSEEVVDTHFEKVQKFYTALSSAGYSGMVFNVAEIGQTKAKELDITLATLSENCINRMSRSMTSDELVALPKLIKGLQSKGTLLLASGVNTPTSMTLVWEYNIPYAYGNMIGSVTDSLDFDFSQVML